MFAPAGFFRRLVALVTAGCHFLAAVAIVIPAGAASAQADAQLVPGHSLRTMHIGKTIIERTVEGGSQIYSYYSPDGTLYLSNSRGSVSRMGYAIHDDQLCIYPNGRMSCYRVYVLDGQPYYVLPTGRAYSSVEYVAHGDMRHMEGSQPGVNWGNALAWGLLGLGAFCVTFGCGGSSAGDGGGSDAGSASPSEPEWNWEDRSVSRFCGKSPDGTNIYSDFCDN